MYMETWLFLVLWYIFPRFWYIVSRKIWQPCLCLWQLLKKCRKNEKMRPQTSQVWFGERERMISTPILALAPLFGAILSQALSPVIVNGDPDQVIHQ
jgi:hypothetical protein